jgi:hypothetical protein
MKSTLLAYLTGLKQMSSKALSQPCTYFKNPGRDFTRRRALYLDRVVWLTVGLLKCTLNIELYHFFDSINKQESVPTKSAFVQARSKILPIFYKDLFTRSVELFYQHFACQRWHEMRLWGVDGTGFRVPDEVWLGDEFGIHENQHADVPSARLICQYDLLNQVIGGLHVCHCLTPYFLW